MITIIWSLTILIFAQQEFDLVEQDDCFHGVEPLSLMVHINAGSKLATAMSVFMYLFPNHISGIFLSAWLVIGTGWVWLEICFISLFPQPTISDLQQHDISIITTFQIPHGLTKWNPIQKCFKTTLCIYAAQLSAVRNQKTDLVLF